MDIEPRKYSTIVMGTYKRGWRGGNMSWAGYDESEAYKACTDIGALPGAPENDWENRMIFDVNNLVFQYFGEMWINMANFNSAYGDWQDIGVDEVYGHKYGGHSYWVIPNAKDMTFDASRDMNKWAEADRNRATYFGFGFARGIKPLKKNYHFNPQYAMNYDQANADQEVEYSMQM